MRLSFAFVALSVVVVLGVTLALVGRPWSSDRSETTNLVPSRHPAATWVTDGEVDDVAQAGGKVFAAGSFTRVTRWTGGLAAVGIEGAQLADALPWIDGDVTAIISDGSDGWYVGGRFDRSEGGRCPNLAAHPSVGPSGSPLCAGIEAVEQLALAGGRLYVSAGGGEARRELVALDTVTGRAFDWKLEAEGGYYANDGIGRDDVPPAIAALATDGETLCVGGFFNSVNGQSRTHLAAIDGRTGQVLPWSPQIDSAQDPSSPVDDASDEGIPYPLASVGALAASRTSLVVGGSFARIDGEPGRLWRASTSPAATCRHGHHTADRSAAA